MTGDLYDLSGKKVSSPSSQPFFFFFPLPFLILFWTMHTKMKFVCCADGVRLYSSQHILLLSLFAGAFQTPFFFFFFSLSLSSHLFSLYTPFHWMFYHYYYFVFFFPFSRSFELLAVSDVGLERAEMMWLKQSAAIVTKSRFTARHIQKKKNVK